MRLSKSQFLLNPRKQLRLKKSQELYLHLALAKEYMKLTHRQRVLEDIWITGQLLFHFFLFSMTSILGYLGKFMILFHLQHLCFSLSFPFNMIVLIVDLQWSTRRKLNPVHGLYFFILKKALIQRTFSLHLQNQIFIISPENNEKTIRIFFNC